MLFDILSPHTTRSDEINLKKIYLGPILGPKRALLPQVLAETKKVYHSLLGHITPIHVLFEILSPLTTRPEEINKKQIIWGPFGAKEGINPSGVS